jgi:hypothetical protein
VRVGKFIVVDVSVFLGFGTLCAHVLPEILGLGKCDMSIVTCQCSCHECRHGFCVHTYQMLHSVKVSNYLDSGILQNMCWK